MNRCFIVVGSGNLAVDIAASLQQKGQRIELREKLISKRSLVEQKATEKGIPYQKYETAREMTEGLLTSLNSGSVTVISAINTYIFPAAVTEHPNFYGINYHNAYLPNHRGMNAEAWVIYGQELETGVTWHRIGAGIDTGGILIQSKIPLTDNMTSMKLLSAQSSEAYRLYQKIEDDLISQNINETQQPEGNYPYHGLHETPNQGRLDLTWDFKRSSAFLRAMDYGILYTLGKVTVEYESVVYDVRRYHIKRQQQVSEETKQFLEGGSLKLYYEGEEQFIALTLSMN